MAIWELYKQREQPGQRPYGGSVPTGVQVTARRSVRLERSKQGGKLL